jgi:hypothetical protein
MARILYSSRSSAIRAARDACKAALDSPIFQAFEGLDYIIHPTSVDVCEIKPNGRLDLGDRWFFELRGPALEAAQQKEDA